MADTENDARFGWTDFYEAVAEKLLDYRTKPKRKKLAKKLDDIVMRTTGSEYLHQDVYEDGTQGLLNDICPFTVMGAFNRSQTSENRTAIASELGQLLDIQIETPTSFEGIPRLTNMKSWFFANATERKEDDIDCLWRIFFAARELAYTGAHISENRFIKAYDDALSVRNVAWNLSIGLYWMRPYNFPSLDWHSRKYIEVRLGCTIPNNGWEYLNLTFDLQERFQHHSDCTLRSYPEISLAAFNETYEEGVGEQEKNEGKHRGNAESYSAHDIVKEGCFLPPDEIRRLLERLQTKKNLILQGPPGTGKTWLAKRLAYALMGEKNQDKVRAVQFHPNLSYEDFVRGWRPSGDGKLTLTDGAFMQAVNAALDDRDSKFVVVIEEINRGNPAQIFGELLTLLEADKRNPDDALELSHAAGNPVYIPENLYVIGTMNLADRSLALVDFALRRRFAFVTLRPQFGDEWQKWIVEHRGVDGAFANTIRARMENLNQEITDDAKLGPQFCIGHSYLTPAAKIGTDATQSWFKQVVETEIFPLLEEYWFDDPDKAQQERDKLLEGL